MNGRMGLRMGAIHAWTALQRRIIDADPPCRGDSRWTSDDPAERAVAAELCADCPLLDECRTFADENREEFAVWGAKDFTVTRRQISLIFPETDE